MAALATVFSRTREQTIALAAQAGSLPDSVRVSHNDLGLLSVAAWIAYIENHAARESVRLRG